MDKWRVILQLEYIHKFGIEESIYGPDDEEGKPEPCDQAGCDHASEPPLTVDEVDEFMHEPLYIDGLPRYHWYAACLFPYHKISDVVYRGGGLLEFCVVCEDAAEQIESWEVFSDAGPGSESMVPTRHRYSYIPLCNCIGSAATFDLEYDYELLGRIYYDLVSAEKI